MNDPISALRQTVLPLSPPMTDLKRRGRVLTAQFSATQPCLSVSQAEQNQSPFHQAVLPPALFGLGWDGMLLL